MRLVLIALVGAAVIAGIFHEDIARGFSKYGVQSSGYGAGASRSGSQPSSMRRLGNSSRQNMGRIGGSLNR
jgi:hypothetical protein